MFFCSYKPIVVNKICSRYVRVSRLFSDAQKNQASKDVSLIRASLFLYSHALVASGRRRCLDVDRPRSIPNAAPWVGPGWGISRRKVYLAGSVLTGVYLSLRRRLTRFDELLLFIFEAAQTVYFILAWFRSRATHP